MRRGSWHILAIALLGLVLAVALGAFAHTIARGTVALPATTLKRASNERLAPAQATRAKPVANPTKKVEAKTRTTTRPTPTTTDDDGSDDDSGRGRGRGSDDSIGSGSSGSGNSGKGSSEPEVEDD